MGENIQNLFITSSNKNNNTNYNYTIYLSNYNIKIKEDEEAYFSITSFQSLNSFYNINENSKSFSVKILDNEDNPFIYNFNLETGNYDIHEFQDVVNNLCSNYFTITYNTNKNKWIYKVVNNNYNELLIRPSIYNYKYFGLKPDEYNFIYFPDIYGNGTYSGGLVNMNNFSLIIIKVIGLVELTKTIDNFNKKINTGDIAAIINRQDSAVNSLINWVDINNNYKKRILNNEINELTFQFYNENNEYLTDLNDWVITLSIITKPKR